MRINNAQLILTNYNIIIFDLLAINYSKNKHKYKPEAYNIFIILIFLINNEVCVLYMTKNSQTTAMTIASLKNYLF